MNIQSIVAVLKFLIILFDIWTVFFLNCIVIYFINGACLSCQDILIITLFLSEYKNNWAIEKIWSQYSYQLNVPQYQLTIYGDRSARVAHYLVFRITFDAHCCHIGTSIKHPVPDQVKPSYIIFDSWALWRWGLSVRVPGCQNYKWRHRMLYTCTNMATVGVRGLRHFSSLDIY